MEILFTIVIISIIFGLLSLTPMFRKKSPDSENQDDASDSENCESCGLGSSCSSFSDSK